MMALNATDCILYTHNKLLCKRRSTELTAEEKEKKLLFKNVVDSMTTLSMNNFSVVCIHQT